MQTFQEIFNTLPADSSNKWSNYFEIYDSFFGPLQEKEVTLLEIGIQNGGSLTMWQKYFPKGKIYGIDIDETCKKFEADNIHVYIGDQGKPEFLRKVLSETGNLDVVVDDGSHIMQDQITSLKTIFPSLTEGGIYLIEDLQTSYLQAYEGSYKGENTCLEFLKGLLDNINRQAPRKPDMECFDTDLQSIHFYENVAVLIKGKRAEPKQITAGEPL